MEYVILENLEKLSSVLIFLHDNCVNKVSGNTYEALGKRLNLGTAFSKSDRYRAGKLVSENIFYLSGEEIVSALWTEKDSSERDVVIDEDGVPLWTSLNNIEKMFEKMEMYETAEYKEFKLSLFNLRNSKTSAKKTPYSDYIRQNYQSVYSYLFNEMVYRVKLEYIEEKKNNPDNNAYRYDVNLPDNIADILPPKIKSRNGYKAQKASDLNSEETSEDIPSHNATKNYSLIPPSSSSWRTDAFFCGRESDLLKIEGFFNDAKNTLPGTRSKLLCLYGERGIGKTSIVKQYCSNSVYTSRYKYVFFMSLTGNSEAYENIIPMEFCNSVRFSDTIGKGNDKPWEVFFSETLEKLKTYDLGKSLFVFDNLDYNAANRKGLGFLYEIISNVKGDYIITTYLDNIRQIPNLEDKHIVHLLPMSESELVNLYINKAQCDCEEESVNEIKNIVNILHFNTLAVEAIACEAYEMDYSPTEVRGLLDKFGLSDEIGLSEIEIPYISGSTTPWRLFKKLYDWNTLDEQSLPYVKQVLFAVALISPAAIREQRLIELLQLDKNKVKATINNLVKRSWINCVSLSGTRMLSMHPLKADVILSITRETGIPDDNQNGFLEACCSEYDFFSEFSAEYDVVFFRLLSEYNWNKFDENSKVFFDNRYLEQIDCSEKYKPIKKLIDRASIERTDEVTAFSVAKLIELTEYDMLRSLLLNMEVIKHVNTISMLSYLSISFMCCKHRDFKDFSHEKKYEEALEFILKKEVFEKVKDYNIFFDIFHEVIRRNPMWEMEITYDNYSQAIRLYNDTARVLDCFCEYIYEPNTEDLLAWYKENWGFADNVAYLNWEYNYLLGTGYDLAKQHGQTFSELLLAQKTAIRRYNIQDKADAFNSEEVTYEIITNRTKDTEPYVTDEMRTAFPKCEFMTYDNGEYFEVIDSK